MLAVVGGIFGLILGSFGTVVAHRVPRHESIITGRSRCPGCGHTITAVENIPVLSYVFLRGRCRHCGTSISPRYPLIEVVTGALFAGAALKFDVSVEWAVFSGLLWTLVVLTVIDLEHKLLPNRIVVPALVLGTGGLAAAAAVEGSFGRLSVTSGVAVALAAGYALLLFWPEPHATSEESVEEAVGASDETARPPEPSEPMWKVVVLLLLLVVAWIWVLSAGIATGPYRFLTGAAVGAATFAGFFVLLGVLYPPGMGGGDIKLSLLLGGFLGYLEAPGVVLAGMVLSFVVGGVASVFLMVLRRAGRKTQIPFGPFLAVGTVIAVFAGSSIVDAYTGSLG